MRTFDSDTGHTLQVDIIEAATDNVVASVIAPEQDSDISASGWTTVGPIAIPGAALGQMVRIEWRFIGNGVENFLGTDPSVFSAGLVSGTVSGNTFTHPQNATPADDLTTAYRWSRDLQDFYADGDPNGAGSTTVSFSASVDDPTPGTTTVTASITGTVIPDKLFVDVEVTQN